MTGRAGAVEDSWWPSVSKVGRAVNSQLVDISDDYYNYGQMTAG
jgi:hypothetical protein